MTKFILLLPLLCGVTSLFAEPGNLPNTPPPSVSEQTEMEPEVTIKHRDGETIEEYRINGRLYMIKVMPDKGLEYFLIDSDGNGSLDARSNQLDPQLMIPSWILFKW
jgi:hypothetical protein